VFTVQERDRVRDQVLELARNDSRVVAGAEVGSLALGGGDRWSDLDLTFGVTDGSALTEVLDQDVQRLYSETSVGDHFHAVKKIRPVIAISPIPNK
jgi:hypothetical protein